MYPRTGSNPSPRRRLAKNRLDHLGRVVQTDFTSEVRLPTGAPPNGRSERFVHLSFYTGVSFQAFR